MRPLLVGRALLFATFLGTLSRLCSGAAVVQTAYNIESRVASRGFYAFWLRPQPSRLGNEANDSPHDEDDTISPRQIDAQYANGIFSRGLGSFIGKIPGKSEPPPPPPLPPPRPGPGSVPPPRRPGDRKTTPDRPEPPPPGENWVPIGKDINPGQGNGLGDDLKQMGTYESAGSQKQKDLIAAVRGDTNDVPIVKTNEELAGYPKNGAFLDLNQDKRYKVKEKMVSLADSELRALKNFRTPDLGFNFKGPGKLLAMTVRDSKKSDSSEAITRATYHKEGEFIIYEKAFKGNNVPDGLPLNEMNMQIFKDVAGDKTKNFKAAFLMDIQNKEFWGITRQNYDDMKQPFTEVLTFKTGTPQFDRYMGSPNLNSKFFSFINHHNALGNKVPVKIVVIPKQVENSAGQLTAAVVFEHI